LIKPHVRAFGVSRGASALSARASTLAPLKTDSAKLMSASALRESSLRASEPSSRNRASGNGTQPSSGRPPVTSKQTLRDCSPSNPRENQLNCKRRTSFPQELLAGSQKHSCHYRCFPSSIPSWRHHWPDACLRLTFSSFCLPICIVSVINQKILWYWARKNLSI
jgi:hypothetical protein